MRKLYKSPWIFLGFLLIQETVNGQEENAALRHKATQSSRYDTWYSEYAVDGVRGSCSHTNTQTDPWWRVDLINIYRVNRVAITNRLSYYSDIVSRINGAVIRVGNFLDVYSNPMWGYFSHMCSIFSCGGTEGRYVIVHIPGGGKILTLCEVEVYGYLQGNRAVDGAASQSSTFENWFPEKATDGNRGLQQLYMGCSSTLSQSNPWWSVDLRDIYRVSRVVVTNRKDCCAERINGAEIHIGNSLENNSNNNPICAVIPAIPAGESYSYSCNGMEGRFVNLIIPGDMKMLTLCEVEVYGEGQQTKTLICFNEQIS
ncbi:pentraxin fusion protein-like [Carassius auratus]|uniref:Pentraxin fusion protein-like n=1 Tax=Carassius auratus TaxID=7957 RepID=A0A6P6PAJ5_CARAU|nr:pentraxin fusion protein-like [Carassius auratus]